MGKIKILGSGSNGNCYLLQTEKEILILEAGLRISEIKKGLCFDLKKVVGALVSHEHQDHFKAVKDLLNCGIEVTATSGTFGDLKDHHNANVVCYFDELKIGNFKILILPSDHDANEPCNFLIKHEEIGKVLFLTDLSNMPYNFKNINTFLIEANYDDDILIDRVMSENLNPVLAARVRENHFSIENTIEFLKKNASKTTENIILTHLSDSNSNADDFERKVKESTGIATYIAEKGLEIII